eukprot:CAMPEP_0172664836 /NCGR_PEP_ID=MMETSP1074-20121228/6862_1 /TAXON_ID=2916 /ORGANISM="Ceratium fusus, Strain PA161109" /LENGTH=597 /DNA_ID=CAMNT_0013481059 /DNA_START=214 /DNA_END=2004 /DNA_ORIENTATION=+
MATVASSNVCGIVFAIKEQLPQAQQQQQQQDVPRTQQLLHAKRSGAAEGEGRSHVNNLGAPLLDVRNVPLRTRGRHIVDASNKRIKWACGNWHGLEQTMGVPGGLHLVHIDVLVVRIRNLGFNCIRLPFSVEYVLTDPPINNSAVSANPQFTNITWRTMFQATVHAIAQAGLMMILDRHMLWAGNNPSKLSMASGLWYANDISASDNVEALELLAEMTANESLVVGMEVINEPHDVFPGSWPDGGPDKPILINWGSKDPRHDLHVYSETAGNAVLAKNPNLLIIVDGLCAATTLDFVRDMPVRLSLPHRIVYSAHSYAFWDFRHYNHGWQLVAVEVGLAIMVVQLLLFQWWLRNDMPSASAELMVCFAFGGLGIVTGCAALVLCAGYIAFYRGCFQFCDYLIQTQLKYIGWVFAALAILFSTACVCTLWWLLCRRRGCAIFSLYKKTFKPGGSKYVKVPLTFTHHPWKWLAALVLHLTMWLSVCGLLFVFVIALQCGIFSTRWWFLTQMGIRWGYLLEEGKPYTAPVWIGEFGADHDSAFVRDSVSYFAEQEVNWGYWPLNPTRPCGGIIDAFTGFQPCKDPDSWVDDPFSVFADDW